MVKKMSSFELMRLIYSEPILYPDTTMKNGLETWKKLKPIDIKEYLKKSVEFLEFDPESIEFKEYEVVD